MNSEVLSGDSDVRAQLDRIEAGIARIVALLEARRSRRRDPATDEQLLAAIAGSLIGGEAFLAADLIGVARIDQALALAIGPAATERSLGLWLRRLARRPVGRYALQRPKRTSDGQTWKVTIK